MARVAVGGTFSPLHRGHKALLKRAFSLGNTTIGLTSQQMAEKRSRYVEPYEIRKERLLQWAKSCCGVHPEVIMLNDPFGSTLDEDFDYIVVSPETHEVALRINEEREKRGKSPIEVVLVPFVLAEDGVPISSSRIARGEIDEEGRLLRPPKSI
ncbi:phosphopantetheine adenylyltransferase [Methermicoccus shengliensis]|uniref:Phosphopantetheine adenylyltransferase n=1 Tax=Methermicoccus shengliensis TaxID=660064 RepID=A0A832RZQ3_9EURY|nr:phosphopantetheine adenylyltransferase [Methermicoccus shengliensis]KUK04305.1 MAG: Phosphopantetheine adenylyltransferase [Euryarchaeota archaeon 55_53]KUK30648.1 MAG: Phosphopantetheine adenylyltransferase [Methanosarcinales archeaon 56_1174]MDI3488197.1 pantetheine-phosphate adenylyltransferase [Methanosarcinales archaeon]MDN5295472.1 pantetheine-phosphate adenylyltransferase [Methanosarcinales archaeon]HIH70236.1 phosphopantetheine adenylyltransferase [Methermicoccus shengliensis]